VLNVGAFAHVEEGEPMDAGSLEGRVADLMPEVLEDLRSLVRIPSSAFPGYPEAQVLEMAERTAALARGSRLGRHDPAPALVLGELGAARA
jgi:hypothetical protein